MNTTLGEFPGQKLAAEVEAAIKQRSFPFNLSPEDALQALAASKDDSAKKTAQVNDEIQRDLTLWISRTQESKTSASRTVEQMFSERVHVLEKILKRLAIRFSRLQAQNVSANMLNSSWLANLHGVYALNCAVNSQPSRTCAWEEAVSVYAYRILPSLGAGPLTQALYMHPLKTPAATLSLRIYAAKLAKISGEKTITALEDPTGHAGALTEHIINEINEVSRQQNTPEVPINQAKGNSKQALLGLAFELSLGGNLDSIIPAKLDPEVMKVLVDTIATQASLSTRAHLGLATHALLHQRSKEESAQRHATLIRAAQDLDNDIKVSRQGLLEAIAWVSDKIDPRST